MTLAAVYPRTLYPRTRDVSFLIFDVCRHYDVKSGRGPKIPRPLRSTSAPPYKIIFLRRWGDMRYCHPGRSQEWVFADVPYPHSWLMAQRWKFSLENGTRTVIDLASKPGLLPQFRTQLRAPTIKCVGGKTEGEGLDDFRT